MIDIKSYKNVLILGYGISGKSVFNFFKTMGFNVLVFDDSLADIPNKVSSVDWRDINLVVKSPAIPFMKHNCHKILIQAKENDIPILSSFDVFKIYNPNAKIIGITGTNGKSTTTALVYHILKNSGFSVQMGGNIGIPFCDLKKTEWYVLEMSSYELASSRYLSFELACLLNIEPDHMEFHGSFENYIEAKHMALDVAKSIFISYEDQYTLEKYSKQKNVTKISLKHETDADICINENAIIENSSNEIVFDLSGIPNLRGEHNRQNVEFAYAICRNLALSPQEISKNIQSFTSLPHRLNIVRKIGNTIFVNDSKATNPCSAGKALAAFVGYKIYWLVGGRSKKSDPIPYVKDFFSEIQKIYLFGESMDEFEAIFRNVKALVKCQTMASALNLAYKESLNEVGLSIVLLSPMCSSFDQFANFEQRGNEFVKIVESFK